MTPAKKFLPVILTLFFSSTLLFSSFLSPASSLAQGSCGLPSEDACTMLNDLFSKQTVGPWYDQTPFQFAKRIGAGSPENEIFGERYTYAQVNWIINSLAVMLNPALGMQSSGDLIKLIQIFGDI